MTMADLSPYHDEDEGLPSLRTNSKQPGGNDRDHHLDPLEDHQASIKKPSNTQEIKQVHMLVQEVINLPMHLLPNSDRIWPGFVHLLR
jgi:hypothetical protein